MIKLKENTIKDLQDYIAQKIKERGFEDESLHERLLLLCEEVGELVKACRKTGIGHIKDTETDFDIAEEVVDVLNMLFAVAVELNLNIERAFKEKEKRIDQRHYARKSKLNV